MRIQLTDTQIEGIEKPAKGQWLIFDTEVKEFALRVLAGSGRKTFIVNLMRDGKVLRRTIGNAERMTAKAARIEAKKIIGQLSNGEDPLQAKRAARAEAEAEAIAKLEAQRERHGIEQQTLRRLCELYVADLQKRGRESARDVLNLFENHVYETPEAGRPACELTVRDITSITRRIVDKGHGRTAAKVRSYLRAAYQRAVAAPGDATVSKELLDMNIELNPVASTASLAQFNNTRTRKLSEYELSQTLRRLQKDDRLPARTAYVGVLLGGQRPTQLLRAKAADFEHEQLALKDGKGKRAKPRTHIVPVIGEALTIVKDLAANARETKAGWLFSSDGKSALRVETVNSAVVAISDELIEEHKASGKKGAPPQPFSLRDLRAAVETQLAAAGVSKDIRGQLLSHGLGGVQDRSYDRHDYMAEKIEALTLLHARVDALTKRRAAKRVAR